MSLILNIQTFSALPVCSAVPVSGSQLINKTYGDATYASAAGTPTLSGSNTWTGTNIFNTNLPTSTQTPTTGAQLVTKTYTDATFVGLTGAQTVAGVKTFSSAPVMSGASITSGTIPAAAVTGVAGTLSGTNAWTGTNSFNTALPTSTVTPSGSTDLLTKAYGDATYGILTAANDWSGAANTFEANPLFPTDAVVGYVATCTDAGTGAWEWTQIPGGPTISTVQTSDATPTSLATVTPASNSVTTITGKIAAASADYSDATGGSFTAVAVNASGTLTLVGTPFVTINASSTASFNVIVSGSDLIVQVTGIAATTYNWTAEYETVVD